MDNYGSNLMNLMINSVFGSRGRFIVVMIVLLCAPLVLRSIFNAKWIGSHGEKLIEKKLKKLIRSGVDGVVLRNVYLPKSNGGTSEIDVLFLTRKGIFVIESKNYSGWIFGDENARQWTATLPNGTKNRFYNPIKQNNTHIKWLRTLLNPDVPLYSLIVFSERCKLKKITLHSDASVVIQRNRIIKTVRSILNQSEYLMSEEEMAKTAEMLTHYTNVEQTVKDAHVQEIKHRFHKAGR